MSSGKILFRRCHFLACCLRVICEIDVGTDFQQEQQKRRVPVRNGLKGPMYSLLCDSPFESGEKAAAGGFCPNKSFTITLYTEEVASC